MKKHVFKSERTAMSSILLGAILGLISLLALTLAFSLLLSFFENPASLAPFSGLLALVISGALTGIFSAKYKSEGGFLTALASAFIACAVIFALGLILSGGAVKLSSLMNILTYLSVCLLFAKLFSRKKQRRHKLRH